MGFEVTNPQAAAKIEQAKANIAEHNRKKSRQAEYERNKPGYLDRAARRYQRFASILREAKDQPCIDCGIELPPECMDLDHVRGTKLFPPGQWQKAPKVEGKTHEEVLREEIAKCDVRCPNCHRLRHHQARLSLTKD